MNDNLLITGFTDDVRGYVATFDVGFMVSYAVESSSFACREMMSTAGSSSRATRTQ
ncbi:hypothetical protein V4C53_10935 [Paraburkholderia azotifigens]|uniref:hypothetical protein n=1 Tax=Paraburkholderia azotifigens TaxID=2057004 RepID=UPI003174C1CF